jgi:hypothetical protein
MVLKERRTDGQGKTYRPDFAALFLQDAKMILIIIQINILGICLNILA